MTQMLAFPNATWDEREIYRDDDLGLVIRQIHGTSPRFNDILALRSEDMLRQDPKDGLLPVPPSDEIDAWSEQYCAYVNGNPVASVRVTRGDAGPADCEEYYPPDLMRCFRHVAVSCSRLIRAKNWTGGRWLVRTMLQVLYRTYVAQGYWLLVITCRERLIPYYEQQGLRLVCGSFFRNPHRGSPNHVMLMSAGRQGRSIYVGNTDLGPTDRDLGDLEDVVRICPDRQCPCRSARHPTYGGAWRDRGSCTAVQR